MLMRPGPSVAAGRRTGRRMNGGIETRGKEEDKEMMTTVGDGGARPCHISHWTGAAPRRRGVISPNIIPSSPTGKSTGEGRRVEERKKWRCLILTAILMHLPPSLHLFFLTLSPSSSQSCHLFFSLLFFTSPPNFCLLFLSSIHSFSFSGFLHTFLLLLSLPFFSPSPSYQSLSFFPLFLPVFLPPSLPPSLPLEPPNRT